MKPHVTFFSRAVRLGVLTGAWGIPFLRPLFSGRGFRGRPRQISFRLVIAAEEIGGGKARQTREVQGRVQESKMLQDSNAPPLQGDLQEDRLSSGFCNPGCQAERAGGTGDTPPHSVPCHWLFPPPPRWMIHSLADYSLGALSTDAVLSH